MFMYLFLYKSVPILTTFQPLKVSKAPKSGTPLETLHIPNQVL